MKIVLKQRELGATNTDFIRKMHTGMLLCFYWKVFKYAVMFYQNVFKYAAVFLFNVFNIHIQVLSDYTLI